MNFYLVILLNQYLELIVSFVLRTDMDAIEEEKNVAKDKKIYE